MKLWINGELKEVRDLLTVSELLEEMKVAAERVAVEVNEVVIRKALHSEHPLAPNDKVEIVTFVGGG